MMVVTRASEVGVPLSNRIDALKRNTAEASPAKPIFETVSHILAKLVRVRTVFPRSASAGPRSYR